MKKVFAVAAALALLGLGIAAQADVFNLGAGFTNLETVRVGDAGNAGELSGAGAGGWGPDRVCGAVNYAYSIGKYEVTAKQYVDFLNAKAKTDPLWLYAPDMLSDPQGCNIQRSGTDGHYTYSVASDWANRPVNKVSYWSSLRFANWLNNGQGNGDTETGAYTLYGYSGSDGRDIVRNPGCKWAVTNEDEWYKAAYYKGGGRNAGYWDYPTKSDTVPSNVGSDGYTDPGNHANYSIWSGGAPNYTLGSPYYRTNAGEFERSASGYGTFDQGGNVWEWTESIGDQNEYYAYRVLRGGSFRYDLVNSPLAANRYYNGAGSLAGAYGFRVVAIPEPSSLVALLGGLMGLLGLRRRAQDG